MKYSLSLLSILVISTLSYAAEHSWMVTSEHSPPTCCVAAQHYSENGVYVAGVFGLNIPDVADDDVDAKKYTQLIVDHAPQYFLVDGARQIAEVLGKQSKSSKEKTNITQEMIQEILKQRAENFNMDLIEDWVAENEEDEDIAGGKVSQLGKYSKFSSEKSKRMGVYGEGIVVAPDVMLPFEVNQQEIPRVGFGNVIFPREDNQISERIKLGLLLLGGYFANPASTQKLQKFLAKRKTIESAMKVSRAYLEDNKDIAHFFAFLDIKHMVFPKTAVSEEGLAISDQSNSLPLPSSSSSSSSSSPPSIDETGEKFETPFGPREEDSSSSSSSLSSSPSVEDKTPSESGKEGSSPSSSSSLSSPPSENEKFEALFEQCEALLSEKEDSPPSLSSPLSVDETGEKFETPFEPGKEDSSPSSSSSSSPPLSSPPLSSPPSVDAEIPLEPKKEDSSPLLPSPPSLLSPPSVDKTGENFDDIPLKSKEEEEEKGAGDEQNSQKKSEEKEEPKKDDAPLQPPKRKSSIPSMLRVPGVPSMLRVPGVPSMLRVPGVPSMPKVPSVPSMPKVPSVVPSMPKVPGVTSVTSMLPFRDSPLPSTPEEVKEGEKKELQEKKDDNNAALLVYKFEREADKKEKEKAE